MADDKEIEALVKPKARPGRKRVSPKSSDASARWTLRGVSAVTRSLAIEAAENKGITVGDWVSEAIFRHFREKDGTEVNVPTLAMEMTLAEMAERLTLLEKERDKGLLRRLFSRTRNSLRRNW